MKRHCIPLVVTFAASITAAQAQPQDPKALFDAAMIEVGKRRYPAALELFERLAQMVDDPDITWQRANCELRIGHFTRARKLSLLSLAAGPKGTGTTLTDAKSTKVLAQNTLKAATESLGTLRLQIKPRGACVRIDGRALEVDPEKPSVWLAGTAPPGAPCTVNESSLTVYVDPGLHTISVAAFRRIPHTFEIVVPTGERRSAVVALEKDPFQTMGIHTLIAAGGMALAGGILGVVAIERQNQSEEQCYGNRCSQLGYSLNQQARQRGDAASVVLGVAGGLGVLGATFLLISANRPRSLQPTVAITTTPLSASFVLRARF